MKSESTTKPRPIKLTEIGLPPRYIRKPLRELKVRSQPERIKGALAKLTKTDHFEDMLEHVKTNGWTFPPIEVIQISESKEKTKKKILPWQLQDGFHRLRVAYALNYPTIQAVINKSNSPGEAFLRQYTANNHHGLKLDRASRDRAIWVMRNVYKYQIVPLGKMAGLTPASISRIAREIQGTMATGKPAPRPKTYQASHFFDVLTLLTQEYDKQNRMIVEFTRDHDLSALLTRTSEILRILASKS